MKKELTPEQLQVIEVWRKNRVGCGAPYIFVVVALLVMLLAGCKSVEYVQVVEHHTDSLYITQHLRDSIYLHDSIHVREKGDTVMIERWHTAWRERLRVDTIFQHRIDTVPMPYPVYKVREVEKPLTWWQKTRMALADILLAGGAIAVIVWHGKKRLKL